jgi:hypothetical protein
MEAGVNKYTCCLCSAGVNGDNFPPQDASTVMPVYGPSHGISALKAVVVTLYSSGVFSFASLQVTFDIVTDFHGTVVIGSLVIIHFSNSAP